MRDMSTIRVIAHSRDAGNGETAAMKGQALCLDRKRKPAVLAGVFTILSIVSMVELAGCNRNQAIKLPDTDVLVANPIQQDVPIHGEWVASTDGFVNAEIRPQVSGYIIKQDYKEGSAVRKGQVLFEIDPRPFQASLDREIGRAHV